MTYGILPIPRKIIRTEGYYPVDETLERSLRDPLMKDIPKTIKVLSDTEYGQDAYSLVIETENITIRCSSQRGRFNACLTLSQMIQSSAENQLPCCRIEDEPVFLNRAVMLDISRNRVYSMDYLKQMIRKLVLLKYNQLQLYTEHTFAYQGHEKVWSEASPYTEDEIRDLDQFCLDRGVELVPNQNSFGHMERWLKHKEYHPIAETPDGFTDPWGVFRPDSSTLAPEVPETMDFIRNLYDQLLPCFSSRQFNIGCDETFDLGLGRSRDLVARKGMGRVYLDFLLKLSDEAAKRGFTVQFWADIILNYPELVEEIPEDLIAVSWGYEANHPFEKETGILKAANRDFYVCTGTSSWNSLAGRWENAYENIKNGAFWARVNGALGYMVTDWGDNGHWQQPLVSWPGFLMASQAAWGGADSLKMEDSQWLNPLSSLIFRDSTGNSALVLRKLSSLYRENPVALHNGSLFNYLFMDPFYPYYRERYEECREGGLGKSAEILEECRLLINDISPESSVSFREELLMTYSMCQCAVHLTQALFATDGSDWEKIPVSEKEILSKEIRTLSDQFSRCWLLSCRPGGLDDSRKKLTGWLDRFQTSQE